MRFLPALALILLGAVSARAQEQERKLVDRLMTPNMELSNPIQKKSYYDGKNFTGARKANVQEFYFPQRYDAKKFTTRHYQAANYWQGEVPFATKPAATKRDERDEKAFATKPAEVKDARESGKNYGTRDYANSREFRDQGKSQKSLDQQSQKKSMNIDEVRELLNKNK